MDIGSKVTVSYLKRGNYVVNNSHSNSLITVRYTSSGCRTEADNASASSTYGQRDTSRVCNCNCNEEQDGGSLCETDRIQRESIQSGSTKQIFRCSWSMATYVGETSLEYTQTSTGSTQIRVTQIRQLVRSVQVPPRKELVLANESA